MLLQSKFSIFLPLLLSVIIALTSCGRKEPPQALSNNVAPSIIEMKLEESYAVIRMTLRLQGDNGGVGFQIDRAELDPYCKCPSMWRRFVEEAPHRKNLGKDIVKMIRVEAGENHYLYRVRAIDTEGRFSKWSKTIQAKIVKLDQ